MTDTWLAHVELKEYLARDAVGFYKPIEEIEIPPMNREQAKAEAWQAADEAMAAPAKFAKQMTIALQKGGTHLSGPAMAPGFKLIAVPVTPAAEASVENQRPETAELTLQSAMRA